MYWGIWFRLTGTIFPVVVAWYKPLQCVIISTKEVTFCPAFVQLFVCLFVSNRRENQTPSDTERMVPPELPEPEPDQHQQQIFAISNSTYDDDDDDDDDDSKATASPKQPQSQPPHHHHHHHHPQQQILAIASFACDDEAADLEKEKNALVLWPTSDAAAFDRYDKQQLLDSHDCWYCVVFILSDLHTFTTSLADTVA